MTDDEAARTGALQPCPHCREPMQAGAKKCPHCREFVDPTDGPKHEAAPKKSSSARSCLALLLLVACVAVFWYLWAPRDQKDTVNRVLSSTGVTVTPWIDRAEASLRGMLERPEQGVSLAKETIQITNPSGAEPRLLKWNVAKQGKTLVAQFDFAWKGGLIGTEYQTAVEWRCNEQGHIQAQVTRENATFGQDEKSRQALDDYFKTVWWPTLYSNTGGR